MILDPCMQSIVSKKIDFVEGGEYKTWNGRMVVVGEIGGFTKRWRFHGLCTPSSILLSVTMITIVVYIVDFLEMKPKSCHYLIIDTLTFVCKIWKYFSDVVQMGESIRTVTNSFEKFKIHLFSNKQSIFDLLSENCFSFSKKTPQEIA